MSVLNLDIRYSMLHDDRIAFEDRVAFACTYLSSDEVLMPLCLSLTLTSFLDVSFPRNSGGAMHGTY